MFSFQAHSNHVANVVRNLRSQKFWGGAHSVIPHRQMRALTLAPLLSGFNDICGQKSDYIRPLGASESPPLTSAQADAVRPHGIGRRWRNSLVSRIRTHKHIGIISHDGMAAL